MADVQNAFGELPRDGSASRGSHQKNPARCDTMVERLRKRSGSSVGSEASEHPFIVDASPEKAGPTDEKGGTDAPVE